VSNLERFSENSLVFSKGVFYYKLCNLESKKYSFFLTSDPIDNVTVENAIEVVPKDKLALGKVDFTLMSGTTSLIVALNNPLKNIDGSDGGTDLQKYYVFAKSDTCEGLIDAKYYREVKATEDSIELNTVGSEAVSLGKTYCVGVLAVDTDNNPVNVVFVSHTEKRIDVVPEYTHIINELAHPQMITLS
jgi:hypothetical protein